MVAIKFRPALSLAACFVSLTGAAVLVSGRHILAQTTPVATTSSATASPTQTPATGTATTPARRRSRRRYTSRPAVTPAVPAQQQTVGLTPEQRRRDAQILASQQAQSAETARQQAIVTGKVIKERQAQQDEPRIQDAPGPGSQPLPGEPAKSTTAPNDPSSIQDAPGPAQTLPQPAPATTTPAPATTPAPQE